MVQTIKAKFANGVFEPLEPSAVTEGAEVLITISTASATPVGDPSRDTAGGWRGRSTRTHSSAPSTRIG